jgi:hypothetical protein
VFCYFNKEYLYKELIQILYERCGNMKKATIVLIFSIMVLSSIYTGCIDTGEMSQTTILISDAPSENFSHINVTFSQVKIHKFGNNNSSGWISFDMEAKTIDMIYLHENNLSEVLGVENLTTGIYTKLWIVVDGATGILKDNGEEIVFDVPSGDLKVQQPFEIREGNTTIDVEIDLERSVLYVPQGGVYKLLPVISTVEIEYGDGDNGDDDDDDEEDFEADAGDDYKGTVGEVIDFNGSASGGVEPYSWNWSFDDGNYSNEQITTHAYSSIGKYDVILTVTDNSSAIATDVIEIEIE